MTDRPVRRVLIVLAIYSVVALLLLPATDWVRRLLALPELFANLVRVGLVAGLPLALLLAWKYPALGHGDGPRPEVRGDSPPGV